MSWDDEDFEVPSLPSALPSNPIIVPKRWDDEEDLLEKELNSTPPPVKLTAAAIEAAKKKAADDELALQTKIQLSLQENETPEQKRAREKKQVEDADNDLAGELFGTSTVKDDSKAKSSVSVPKGIASAALKTKVDHTNFGVTISQRLSDSSAFNVIAFYKSLSKTLESSTLTSESIDEIMNDIKAIRDEKLKLEKPAKQAVAKKSKKDIKGEEKKHGDVFGMATKNRDVDKYDHYSNMEDDYM